MLFDFPRKLLFLQAGTNKLVEDTATGNPLTFVTNVAKALRSLVISLLPRQSGTGDPSPSNIRSIIPWDGLTVFGSGQNIITNGFTNGVLNLNTGAKSTNPNYITSEYIPVVPLKSYYFKCPTVVSSELDICYYDKDKHYIGYADADGYVSCNAPGRSRKTPAGCYYVRIDARNAQYNNDICINYPASVTGYVPAVGITETDIVFPSPVYGGTLDVVSGVLMTGWKVETLDDVDAWTQGSTFISYINHEFNDREKGNAYTGICSALPIKNNVPSGTAYMRWGGTEAPNILISSNGSSLTLEDVKTLSGQGKIVLAYPLETPQTVQLTPQQLTALVGTNTIWSDTNGENTVVFLKKA